MSPALTLALRRSATARAHAYGAEALILEREAQTLLARAATARQRYYRELETTDLLGGHPSPFGALGVEPAMEVSR